MKTAILCLTLASFNSLRLSHDVSNEPLQTVAFDGRNWFMTDVMAPKGFNFARTQDVVWTENENCQIPPPRLDGFASQGGEDRDLYNAFFCNKTGGHFVEMGALNGIWLSNTIFFEEQMKWSGMLIEGSPESAKKLVQNRQNVQNKIVSGAVCPDGQNFLDLVDEGFAPTRGDPNVMSNDFKNDWDAEKLKTVRVPCRPLSALLKEYMAQSGADHIDFFSLDVEGGELAVLKTFDFEVPVNVWVIEMDGGNKEKDEAVRQLLREHDYVKSTKNFAARNEIWVLPKML